MLTEIEGQVKRVTFRNEETGFTIAGLLVKGYRESVTISGNLISVTPGEVLNLQGEWYNHPRYGRQFKFEKYKTIVPATAKGIEKYLGSGLIKGIGPVMAKRVVKKFGTETLNIIEHSIERLTEVDGIGAHRVQMIKKAWEEQKEVKEVMIFLQGHGVSTTYAAKIFKHYGQSAITVVNGNPYRLTTDIFGIGFISADKIAENLGIAKDSPKRAEAGILYVLSKLSDNDGHLFYPYELLIEECKKVLNIEKELIAKSCSRIETEKRIVIDNVGEGAMEANRRGVYLTKYYIAEIGVSEQLNRVLKAPKKIRPLDIGRAIEWVQKETGIMLAENQVKAIEGAMKEKVIVITGGPGTGKTTIINSIIKLYRQSGQRIMLAAPTGRASKKMSEATGYEAKTIHRLLEFSPKEGGFKRNEESHLNTDLIVIDETSMVDIILMHNFLKAVPNAATLIFVGDVDQLPSVGAGNVLKDIINSGVIPTVTLTEIFRQSEESLIVTNAHKVNKGHMPNLNYSKERLQDFYFFQVEEPEKIVERIIELCMERIPKKFHFDSVNDIQVLTAMHRGLTGTANLNTELQKHLNSSSVEITRGGKTLKRGDKVMQIVNNYDKEVYNGDIGRVIRIDREEQELDVDFEGRHVTFEYADLDEIVLAYAVSVHKSQGSEYPVVVMPLHTQHYLLLQRNLLYTGITRGKRLVVIVGTKKALGIAINNNKPRKRYTYLKNRLKVE